MNLLKLLIDKLSGINKPQQMLSPVPQGQPSMTVSNTNPWLESMNKAVPKTVVASKAVNNRPNGQYYMDFGGQSIPQPPLELAKLLFQYLPNEATSAATVAYPESGYNKNAINRNNSDGSADYGTFQTNSKTMNEMLRKPKYGNQLRQYGINKPEDVLGDFLKAVIAAKVTRQYEDDAGVNPWSWWYGHKDRGYKLQ